MNASLVLAAASNSDARVILLLLLAAWVCYQVRKLDRWLTGK